MTASRANLVRRAEAAWLDGDLATSTASLRAAAGVRQSLVTEAAFDPSNLPDGVSAAPLSFNGLPVSSHLVRFDRAAALFDIGVPLLPDGTFFSQVFAHLKYPERYSHLFTDATSKALSSLEQHETPVPDGYIAPIRPPYYHWLLDTLPHLLGASRLGQDTAVNLIGPADAPPNAWQRDLLSRAAGLFGIDNLKWLPVSGTVVAVSPGYAQTRMPLAERLRVLSHLIPGNAGQAETWLYAKRGHGEARQLRNEDQVIEALGPRFKVIEPGSLPLDDQMRAFAEARCVVGVHGSNLTNIAFCKPGTRVIEIAAGLPQPHFERICEVAGLPFHRVAAQPQSADAKGEPTWTQAHGDLTVAPQDVVDAVEAALSRGS